jgi:hypothetical protein
MPDLLVALPGTDDLLTFLTEGSSPFIGDAGDISAASLARNLGAGYLKWSQLTGWNPFEAEAADVDRYFTPPQMSNDGWVIWLDGGLVDEPTSVVIGHDRADAASGTALDLYTDYDLVLFDRRGGPYDRIILKTNPGRERDSIKVTGKFGFVANGAQAPADAVTAILQLSAQAAMTDQMGVGGIAKSIREGPVSIEYGEKEGSAVTMLGKRAAMTALAYRTGE